MNTESLNLQLIEGNFTHEEAKELLFSLFTSKINFHQIKNFSAQERFGKDDLIAVERIPKLKEEMNKLENFIQNAPNQNKKMVISATITLSFLDQ